MLTDSSNPCSPQRQRVINGASLLFTDFGYADVSMQQIAESVGITKATLYHHFRDKEELFLAAMISRYEVLHADLTAGLNDCASLDDCIRTFVTIMLASTTHGDLHRFFSDFKQYVAPARQREILAQYSRPYSYLERPLSDAMERGEIAPGNPRLLAQICLGAVMGPGQSARSMQAAENLPDNAADVIASVLLAGLRDGVMPDHASA